MGDQNPNTSLTKMGNPIAAIWAIFSVVFIAVLPQKKLFPAELRTA